MISYKRDYKEFLNKSNFISDSYKLEEMQCDCSKRQYLRVYDLEKATNYVLMDSSAEEESFIAFNKVSSLLMQNNLRVPKIYYQNSNYYMMIIEDFGNISVSKALSQCNQEELSIYKAATQILIQAAKIKTPIYLPNYDSDVLNRELQIFIDWALKFQITDSKQLNHAAIELYAIFNTLYKKLESLPNILVLRDYHADNLMLLAGNSRDYPSIGLLDFQDALLGHHCYDLVSLLEDARRDINHVLTGQIKEYYFQAFPNIPLQKLEDAYAILGMQRNLKIIGIFNRLSRRDNNNKYLGLIPRVAGYITRSISNPIFLDLKSWLQRYLKQNNILLSH